MSGPTSTDPKFEQVLRAIYTFTLERVQRGQSDAEIEAELRKKGLESELAVEVVGNVRKAVADARIRSGRKNMILGSVVALGGIAIVVLTAINGARSFSSFALAAAVVLLGAAQFWRGWAQIRQ